MSLHYSPIVFAEKQSHSANFSIFRLDRSQLVGFIEPVMGFDHFVMAGPTFSPHPHAGFSAITYVFEDSVGGMRNRDSLGHDLVVSPGEILWTQAGDGVIHDDFPAEAGKAVHGLQLFVNLSRQNKHLAPQMYFGSNTNIATYEDAQNRIRVLSGSLGDVSGAVKAAEPFDFLDARLEEDWIYAIKPAWNVMLYVLSGEVEIRSPRKRVQLVPHEAIGIRNDASAQTLTLTPKNGARLLLLSGKNPGEPVATYGPFIMNNQAELDMAYEKYRSGGMGRLSPLEQAFSI